MYQNLTFFKISGICGILSPFIASIFVSLAIYYSPWFSFRENFLSDIGGPWNSLPIYTSRGLPSLLFNIGLILGGTFALIFAIGIRKSNIFSDLGTKFLIINAISFIGLGVFPLTILILHIIFGIIFFLTIPLTLIFIGKEMKDNEKNLKKFIKILGIISLISFFLLALPTPYGRNAIIELISVFGIFLFYVIFGVKLFKMQS